MPVTNYIWDVESDSYLMETDETDTTTAVYTNEPNQYGNLVSQRRGTSTSYYHYDAQGSTRELTIAAETVTDTFLFNAFGEEIARTGTTIAPFRYIGEVGYYYDPETGEIYVRARIYDPTIARWTSSDPIRFTNAINLYGFCDNNSVNVVDPSGMLSTKMIAKNLILKNCGLFCYPADWVLGENETDGFIIQRVTLSMWAKACDSNNIAFFADCKDNSGLVFGSLNTDVARVKPLEYFEMWPVKAGEVYESKAKKYPNNLVHDILGVCISDPSSKTLPLDPLKIKAQAFFLAAAHPADGWADPPLGWDKWEPGGVNYAGQLLSICASDAPGINLPREGVVVRTIEYSWDCCCDGCTGKISGEIIGGTVPGGTWYTCCCSC